MHRSVSGCPYARRMAGGDVLHVRRGLDIPLSEITWRASTPGGPGGQHANRSLTRQRARLLERVGAVVRASAAESRSQARNRELALARLAARIDAALRVDPVRTPTKPTKSSQVRRVEAKRRRSDVKRGRRPPGEDD